MLKTGQCKDETCTYAHSKQELRAASGQKGKKAPFSRNLKFGGDCSHGTAEISMPATDPIFQLPPGLDLEGLFGDDDEETSYVSNSNADSVDNLSDQDSSPTRGTDMGEPAYVRISSVPDFDELVAQQAMESFNELSLQDSTFYSLGDFTGIDPSIALANFTGDWGVDPLTEYMNSSEFWQTDPMSEYYQQAHGWDWQGFDQHAVIS
jgi:hypothetical protein